MFQNLFSFFQRNSLQTEKADHFNTWHGHPKEIVQLLPKQWHKTFPQMASGEYVQSLKPNLLQAVYIIYSDL
jgi:hypothetical protein